MDTTPPEDLRRMWTAMTGLSETVVEIGLTLDDLGNRIEEVERGLEEKVTAMENTQARLTAALAALQHKWDALGPQARFF